MQPKIFFFGFLIWFVPFFVACFLMDMRVNQPSLFKSIMIVIGSLTGHYLTMRLVQQRPKHPMSFFLTAGFVWFSMNILLDISVLIHAFQAYSYAEYFSSIGLRYLPMIMTSALTGYTMKVASQSH